MYSASGPKKLLSLVTFFAWDQSKALKRQLWSTAKKVTPAPGRGELIHRHEYKLNEKRTPRAAAQKTKAAQPAVAKNNRPHLASARRFISNCVISR
ncbi:hypothetical protein GCM10010985_47120 [Caballeronia grimmiae]|uniref:60S ribosomal protein L28 n=1 Tax=Caballeronia grimmiae TaxID=1071679 RepID=A0ABQ1S0B6_9BURK|nr:hypothetical protein GCM10010985_47120 [Caballeronia grimmiae]